MKPETMMIDDVKHVSADKTGQPAIPGKREVVVVDRGWIYADDGNGTTKKIGIVGELFIAINQ